MGFVRLCMCGAFAWGLAACGGGGTGGAVLSSAPITVSDINTAGADYFAFAQDDDVQFLSAADLAAQGSAQLDGYMLGVLTRSADAIVGRATLDVTFTDGGALTGDVTQLVFIPENPEVLAILTAAPEDGFTEISEATSLTPLTGSLNLSDGTINTQNGIGTIGVGVDGTVEIPGAIFNTPLSGTQTFDVSGSLSGGLADSGDFVATGGLVGRSQDFYLGLQSVIFAQ